MISLNAIRDRKSDFPVQSWILDSAAFTEITRHGQHRMGAREYVAAVRRWARCGHLDAAVIQDWMCEPFVTARTGLTVAEHQARTLASCDELRTLAPDLPWLPVLQGFTPPEYAAHVRAYGDRLEPGAWVGVGGVCKRNKTPGEVEVVLLAIKAVRPDLRLHGFGVKTTALKSGLVRSLLWSADSMAWSYAGRKARRAGDLTRSANHWREAARFAKEVETVPIRDFPLWAPR